MIPPRCENSPGSSTAVVFWKPLRTTPAEISSTASDSPVRRVRVCWAKRDGLGTGCKRAGAGDDDLGRLGTQRCLEHADPIAEGLVLEDTARPRAIRGRETTAAPRGRRSLRSVISPWTSSSRGQTITNTAGATAGPVRPPPGTRTTPRLRPASPHGPPFRL